MNLSDQTSQPACSQRLLVVGQGLAGTVAALIAAERGWDVAVVDAFPGAASSRAAAGILNPVTGPRLNLSWNIDSTLPAAEAFYRNWQRALATTFFEPKSIRRIFRSPSEIDYHTKNIRNPVHQRYLGPLTPSPNSALGECTIRAAVLNIPSFLAVTHTWLQQHARVLDGFLDYEQLELHEDRACWQGQVFDKVLFCEGHFVKNNPWFNCLPFKPAKGQSISLRCENPIGEDILSSEKWLLPLEGSEALVGSTYEWHDLDEQPTANGRDLLVRKAQQMLPENAIIEVLEHRAGVRPCSHDRRPYLGLHPSYPALGIINGMGSKGTLFSPWCAQQWFKHVESNQAIDPAVSIGRCRKVWRNQLGRA